MRTPAKASGLNGTPAKKAIGDGTPDNPSLKMLMCHPILKLTLTQ
jgi:hypothetical protein